MTWLLIGIAVYLTYYTAVFALDTWKQGKKIAAFMVWMLTICFLPLSILLSFFR